LGIGDWGLGIGDWGLGPIPNPQSPIPNPPIPKFTFLIKKLIIIKLICNKLYHYIYIFYINIINLFIFKEEKYKIEIFFKYLFS